MNKREALRLSVAALAGVIVTLGVQQIASGPARSNTKRSTASRNVALPVRDPSTDGGPKLNAGTAGVRTHVQGTADRTENATNGKRGEASGTTEEYRVQGAIWREQILQVRTPSLRQRAWGEVLDALGGADPSAHRAALWTILYTSHVTLERAGVRASLVGLSSAESDQTRSLAWQAIVAHDRVAATTGTGQGTTPGDRARLLDYLGACPAEFRERMLACLLQLFKQKIDGALADSVLKLLEDSAHPEELIQGLSRAREISQVVEAKLLNIAESRPAVAKQLSSRLFSKLDPKRPQVVDFLLRQAEFGDPAALRALRTGVSSEQRESVTTRLRELLRSRALPAERSGIIVTIGHIAGEDMRAWLTSIRDDASANKNERYAAVLALRAIDANRKPSRRRKRK